MTLSRLFKPALIAASVAAAAFPAIAQARAPAASADDGARNCFYTSQWRGWSSPSRDVLLLRVNNKDIYRVDLTPGPNSLRAPGAFLVNKVRGSNLVCSAIDLNLAVSEGHGFSSPLIARELTKLSPAEIAQIPKRYLP